MNSEREEQRKIIIDAAEAAAKIVSDATSQAARVIENAKNGGRRIFGFSVQEISILVAMLSSLLFFYWRTDDTLRRLVTLGEYITKFMQNSDNYNSAKSGIQFAQGMPSIAVHRGE